MGVLSSWRKRRRDLAYRQLEADRAIDDIAAKNPATDAVTGGYYAGRRALGGILNPKAKTRTEWRGD